MFISSYITIHFFVKKLIFSNVYFSECNIRMFLYVFYLKKEPSIKYVRNWWEMGVHLKCLQLCIGGKGVKPHVYVLAAFLLYIVLFCL